MQTVLITGATSGIGKEMAKIFAKKSYNLILVSRSEDKMLTLKNELEAKYSICVEIYKRDLSIPEQASELLRTLKNEHKKINILVNNAGIGRVGRFVDDDIEKQINIMKLNMDSLIILCHGIGREMKARGEGQILNVASIASFMVGPYMSVYYATKAFVLHFSEGLREELLPFGISVSTLCPGPTKTEFFKGDFVGTHSMENLKRGSWAMQSAHDVAKLGVRLVLKKQSTKISGWISNLLYPFIKFLPRIIIRKAMKLINQ